MAWASISISTRSCRSTSTFTDDAGKQVTLASYFGKRPAILALVYYRCPMLCSEELDGLTSALEMVRSCPGQGL